MLMPRAAFGPVNAPAKAIVVPGAQVALPSPAGSAALAGSVFGTCLPLESTCATGWMDRPPAPLVPEDAGSLLVDLLLQPVSTSAAPTPITNTPRIERLRHVELSTSHLYVLYSPGSPRRPTTSARSEHSVVALDPHHVRVMRMTLFRILLHDSVSTE